MEICLNMSLAIELNAMSAKSAFPERQLLAILEYSHV